MKTAINALESFCFQYKERKCDLKSQRRSIRFPTLAPVGKADWVTLAEYVKTIASLIPNSKLIVFEDTGHSPQIGEFDRFQTVIRDFLAEVLS